MRPNFGHMLNSAVHISMLAPKRSPELAVVPGEAPILSQKQGISRYMVRHTFIRKIFHLKNMKVKIFIIVLFTFFHTIVQFKVTVAPHTFQNTSFCAGKGLVESA
jgi:hypothetical protein